MKIAVEGCCHGELDTIYETLGLLEKKNNIKVDLLLICGDFQSVRNTADMECMAVPPRHRKMNTFYKYYSGEKVAPVLTIFIGGNHEASNYLQELPYGGWVAPKIFYLGYAGVVQYRGVRIGGLSGIYKGKDYMKGHFEHPPYTEDTKRSAYHVRNIEVFRLKQIQNHIDIFLSHDWPRGIHSYGNAVALVNKKKYFKDEVEQGILGSPVAAELLYALQPSFWFAAHLHVKFPALVQHLAEDESKVTKFLALDKCLPRRQFLQVLDVQHDPDKPSVLQLDPEWLVILKLTNHLLDLTQRNNYPGPSPGGRTSFKPTEEDLKHVKAEFGGDFSIPENFEKTVAAYNPDLSKKQQQQTNLGPAQTEVNPQTTLICSMLDLTDPNAVFLGRDSTYKLGDDENDTQELDDDDDDEDKPDDVEDEESEPSFILSESDRSYSLLSASNDSFLSAGNDSFQSGCNESFLSAVNESSSSLGNPDEISIDNEQDDDIDDNDDDDDDDKKDKKVILTNKLGNGINATPAAQSLNNTRGKRMSIAERLAQCAELNKSNSASSTTSEEDDLEFQAIMSAQKAKKDLQGSNGKNASCSDSSLDCKKLENSDEDAEFREMMQAQQESHKGDNKRVMELSLESEDVEFKEIMKSQRDTKIDSGSIHEIQKDFVNLRPTYQSSPLVSNEDRVAQSVGQQDLSPSHLGMKRGDAEKTNETPASKKFRRRNQELYSDTSNSTGDESL